MSEPLKETKPKQEPKTVWFESREKEPSMFDCMDIRPIRNYSNGHLEWEVPSELVERFARHHFVDLGRIVRKA